MHILAFVAVTVVVSEGDDKLTNTRPNHLPSPMSPKTHSMPEAAGNHTEFDNKISFE